MHLTRMFLMLLGLTTAFVSANGKLTNFEQIAVNSIHGSRESVGRNLEELASIPHPAGSNDSDEIHRIYFDMLSSALQPLSRARNVRFDNHSVLISLPESASLSVGGTDAELEEKPFAEDPTSNSSWNSKIWSAYGSNAQMSNASAVYVNYGRAEDFELLDATNRSVADCIVIIRDGGCRSSIAIREAQQRQAKGVLVFSDPKDSGGPDYPTNTYPNGMWLPSSGTRRFSALNSQICPGNPSGRDRVCGASEQELIPSIPVMPISADTASLILKDLGGDPVPTEWSGGLPQVVYTFGPGPENIDFSVKNRNVQGKVVNIIATFPGSAARSEDYSVVIGNHRDAWIYGASNPTSGSVAMIEVAKGLANAWEQGWRPYRTIVLGSWDAKELGMIGSTGYVEANVEALRQAAIYINVDAAVSGTSFTAAASPSVVDSLAQAARDIDNFNRGGVQLGVDAENVGPLGGNSDEAPFLNHLGIASVSFGFERGEGDCPVHNSIYDSVSWMTRFGDDSSFSQHLVISELWALLTMRMATHDVLPLAVDTLGIRLQQYVEDVIAACDHSTVDAQTFTELHASVNEYRNVSRMFMEVVRNGSSNVSEHNRALAMNEKAFLTPRGLPGRQWYRNVLMATSIDKGIGVDVLPALMEAVKKNNSNLAQTEASIVQDRINASIYLLLTGDIPEPDPHINPNDVIEDGVIASLILGLAVLLLGTVYLAKLLSKPRTHSHALLNKESAWSRSPVTLEHDDGTSTDV